MHLIVLMLCFWHGVVGANMLYLNKNQITITPQFRGDYISLYGAKPEGGYVIIVLKGEKETYYIQKKEKKFGIWIKGEKKKVEGIYRYYNIFSEKSLDVLNIPHLLRPFEIGIENINTYSLTTSDAIENFDYKSALFDYKKNNNLYKENYSSKITKPESLMYLQFHIPPNIPEGNYIITVYTVENQEINNITNMPVRVVYNSFLQFVTHTARHQKFLYLFLSLSSSIGLALCAYVVLGKKYTNFFHFIAKFLRTKKKKKVKIKKQTTVSTGKRGRPKKIQN